MFAHYVSIAFRNIRSAPFASIVNLLTLAVGLVCFVTAYAFVTFWGAAERHFPKSDDISVLTATIKNRENGFGIASMLRVPEIAADTLKSDFPAISKVARALVIDRQAMVASGDRAIRLFGVAVDPEFLEMFDLPFISGDSSALSTPRSAVLTKEYATRLFGTDSPIGKSIVIGNAVDATVTGVIDAIPEPSHMGRSANAMLPFDMLTSRDVGDAIQGSNFAGAPPGSEWFRINALVYVYLPAGGLSASSLRSQLVGFAERHIPEAMRRTQDYTASSR